MSNQDFPKSKVLNLAEMVDYQAGAIVSRTIMKQEMGNLTLFAFAKGQGLSEHAAPFDAMVQVLDGTGEILIAGETFIVPAGNTIIMPANIPHAVVANENFKMMLTMLKA
ncbi:MAG: cupin domain-containing protein [Bacteroidales bacterium]|nr:cupin domain-containing protein [Bacteroidales bacterium]